AVVPRLLRLRERSLDRDGRRPDPRRFLRAAGRQLRHLPECVHRPVPADVRPLATASAAHSIGLPLPGAGGYVSGMPADDAILDPAIDAALALAAERPWREVSLREIAERAGADFAELYAKAPAK